MSKRLYGHLYFISEYSVYSLIKITARFTWRYLKRILPVFWVILLMLTGMTKANGQPENSRYRDVASGLRLLVSMNTQYRHSVSQGKLKQIAVQKADKTKNILFAVGALLLIIGILLVELYRTTLKNNRLLKAQQQEIDQKHTFIETLNSDQEKLLKEKEWLIKEVQHRVKNNLQIVTSLLYSQSVYLEDNAAVLAIKDSLRRMQAMSLIHQRLYQDKNINTISMPEYIDDLVKYLHASFDADNHIVFEQVIAPVELDVSQVLPLGLILTESIVNAIKYAFLNGEQGIVRISLEHDKPEHLLLKISDNGIGLPAGLDTMEHNSLGLDLIQGLSKQLKGSFQIENNNGVHITVRFAV